MNGMNELQFQMDKGIQEENQSINETKVLFVIDGNTSVDMLDTRYVLKKEDVLLINSGMPYAIRCDENAIIARAFIPYQELEQSVDAMNRIIICNSTVDDRNSYLELRNVFHELIVQEVQQLHRSDFLKKSLMYKLLDCLTESFCVEYQALETKGMNDQERLRGILKYINQNFRENMSLTELADQMYVSASTLSRVFKKYMGVNFAEYVNQVRVRAAVQALLYTEDSITKVATDCGFSNPSAFNRVFKSIYQETPTNYRKRYLEHVEENRQKEQIKKEALLQDIRDKGLVKEIKAEEAESFDVDLSQKREYLQPWNKVITVGSLHSLTLANLQYHTVMLKEKLDLTHVRLWNVFSKHLQITDGKRIGHYNYDMVDGVLDFLTSKQLHLFIDFGKRTSVALKTIGVEIYREDEAVDFQSRGAWESMLNDFISHVVSRYGKEEVSHWIFELSCNRIYEGESDCYADSHYRYFDAYQYLYHTVKRIVPEAEVGGPMSFSNFDEPFLREFLQECKKTDCTPDFVSCALFPYEVKRIDGELVYARTVEDDFEQKAVERIKTLTNTLIGPGCKLYVTELNNTLSSRNYLNDSCFRSAYFVRTLAKIFPSADLVCVWVGSDWISSYYDTVKIANGGGGILTKNSIRKPIYFALEYLSRLGNQMIAIADHYIITGKGDDEYYILCSNFRWYGCNYFIREENTESPEQIEALLEEAGNLKITLRLHGLENRQKYVIKRRTIEEGNGSILGEWKKFQYEDQLLYNDVKYIRDMCFPRKYLKKAETKDGTLDVEISMKSYEVSLLHIYREGRND